MMWLCDESIIDRQQDAVFSLISMFPKSDIEHSNPNPFVSSGRKLIKSLPTESNILDTK